MKGKETDYILDRFADRSQKQTVEAMDEIMRPGLEGYKVRDQTFYLLGPFHKREELLERLEKEPLLEGVYLKWKKFDGNVLDNAFDGCKAVYLQIRWEGWFVRPVRELTKEQFTDLLNQARSAWDVAADDTPGRGAGGEQETNKEQETIAEQERTDKP